MLKKIVLFIILSRVFLLLTTFVIANSNGVGDSFTNFADFLTKYAARWDGNSYSFIAKKGYVYKGSESTFIVFPPVYPIIMSPFGHLIDDYPLAGMILSNIFFILAVTIFYKLLRLDYSRNFSLYVIFLISIFPTSFFFSVAYPESLYFLIFSMTFYLMRIRKIKTSFILSTLAPLTRPFGIGIYPSLFAAWFSGKNRKLIDIVILFLSFAVAIFIYLLLNYAVFNNPFAFQKILQGNWQKSFTLPWKSILSSWKRGIFTPEWSEYKIMIGYAEAVASTAAWSLTIASLFIKKLRLRIEYFVYLLVGVFFFTSTGFILSAPRYLISLPPLFIILARLTQNIVAKIIWVTTSLIFLIFLSVRWANGWWAF